VISSFSFAFNDQLCHGRAAEYQCIVPMLLMLLIIFNGLFSGPKLYGILFSVLLMGDGSAVFFLVNGSSAPTMLMVSFMWS
jgi:hypothetical protein